MKNSVARRQTPKQIEAIYRRLAIVYDVWTWMFEKKGLDVALERAQIRNGESVLEVAVGSGHLFREILRRNPAGRTVGVDLTEAMLRKTQQKASRTGVPFLLQRGDARQLPFADSSFDLVLNNNMLGLLPPAEIVQVLAEMMRVVRPGGRLIAVLMSRPQKQIPLWIYQFGAVRLGSWSDVDLDAFAQVFGPENVNYEVVTQLGFPSDILCARKPIIRTDAK